MIKVYINGFFSHYANYCKACEEAIAEVKNNKNMRIYCDEDYKTITILDTDIITAIKE